MRIYTGILLFFFTCCSLTESFAQDTIDQKTLFIIDSVPRTVIEEDDQSLPMSDIYAYRRITDKDSITSVFNLIGPDTLVFILTKLYMERPDSIKRIPSLSSLKIKKNKYYLTKEDTTGYTGNFIETYLNGAKRFVGTIEKGEITGYASQFYPDGTLRYSTYYKHNKQDGILEEYFPNGMLKGRGEMVGGILHGLWGTWYSSGKQKEVMRYWRGQSVYIQGSSEFYAMFDRAKADIESKHYSSALSFLNRCIQMDENIDYIYSTKGTVYFLQNKFAKAIEAYTQAIQLEPMESSFYISRARATMKLIEENANTPNKLKNLETLKTSICDDYLKAVQLGERNIQEGAGMRTHCL